MDGKVLSQAALVRELDLRRQAGARIVFTNGCFDLLHVGHTRYLQAARKLGDVLVVGVNTDRSVRGLKKGAARPIVPDSQRAEVLAALACVDYVVLFDEPDPYVLIRAVQPDVLVKGGGLEPGTDRRAGYCGRPRRARPRHSSCPGGFDDRPRSEDSLTSILIPCSRV